MSTFKTATATKSDIKMDLGEESALMNLPLMRHFDVSELKTTKGELKPGAKMISHFLMLIAGISALYFFGVYAAPIIFVALGKLLAVLLSVGILFFVWLARRPIRMIMDNIAKNFHKFAVRQDPFGRLEKAKQDMIANKRRFQVAKAKISNLKTKSESESAKSEEEAKEYQQSIQRANEKSHKLKAKMVEIVSKGGEEAKNTDEYTHYNKEWMEEVANGTRLMSKYQQAKIHTVKYGARAHTMGTLDRKLVLVGTSIDIKIDDFDSTVEILKKDYEFAKNSREATQSAKDAMRFTSEWEVDYALEVVTDTIIDDIANTAANLRDIDDFTNLYGVDSDELYAKLEQTAKNISIGEDTAPQSKVYKNPDYILTTDDKVKGGDMTSIF